ncbi:NAD(P)(+) transhydrogenase (Re/Si-specific) subunit alpha [Pseudactinotalea sp. Z1739]|uniref:NAD(P)(+) transhydrogenase (Re/Si-specific) subunit alpha n=1 Tax=Pseudactinotalea sp. Z1739 TaxID=3413028 RepID=UPI003C7C7CBA
MSTVVALREPDPETRVALVPEVVAQLVRHGLSVTIQSGAGTLALHTDDDFAAAGATVATGGDLARALATAQVLVHVQPLDPERIAALPPGMITLGLTGGVDPVIVEALNAGSITALSFERLPRTSRAQVMDVLSSQAFVAGYRAVLEAAIRLPRFFPLAMTAAGTVPPAKVIVLGVGVAGLQAIATARRLGAKVAANDIRPDSAEEVRSVGAEFIDVGIAPQAGAGGYARDLDAGAAHAQQDVLANHIMDADVLITTASVPGRPAPRLVAAATVAAMRPGSVVVDLAASAGGNVEGSLPGVEARIPSTRGGGEVTLLGLAAAAADLPVDASGLFARNVAQVLRAMVVEDGSLTLNLNDELIHGMCYTHEGGSR